MRSFSHRFTASLTAAATFTLTALPAVAALQVGGPPQGPALVPTGQFITATAAPGSTFMPLATGLRADGSADAAEAVKTALSPDGTQLLVLTSGYNNTFYTQSGTPITYPVIDPTTGAPSSVTTKKAEWVFVFDVRGAQPVKLQQINVPNTYNGLVWDPSGTTFYVSGGIDDRVYAFARNAAGAYAPRTPFILLGHNSNQTAPFPTYDGGLLKGTAADAATGGRLRTGAVAAGIAVSADGSTLAAANLENDSITLANPSTGAVLGDVKFTVPGQTTPIGEYPYDVQIKSGSDGKPQKIYVSSQRDDQVVVVTATGAKSIIPVGDGPNRMLLTPDGSKLWVCNANSDTLSVIDTTQDRVIGTVSVARPGYPFKGANPNSLALNPDGTLLYVTLGGENAVAVVSTQRGVVLGRIPTGWSPTSVTLSADGTKLYVINAKAPAGPNPANRLSTAAGYASNTTYRNEYGWALEKAGLLTVPLPISAATLAALSAQVDRNNGFAGHAAPTVVNYLHSKIKHVIYIVNENRTYDQVLGDLAGTNGDPTLNLFPQAVSPNHHALAATFGALDNFYDPGESSGVGWNWSMEGYDTDYTEKAQSVLYGNAGFNGLTYDYQGENRNINVSFPVAAGNPSFFTERITSLFDPSGSSNILPGPKDVAAPYNANNEKPNAVGGYLFDSVLRAGGTIRNYGWQIDQTAYGSGTPLDPALVRHPYENGTPQAPPSDAALNANTDVYYRGFDQRYPDKFRIEEWQREFAAYVQNGNLPTLETLTIPHDHFGSFGSALEGLNTPTTQFADNDYAIAQLVEAVSTSRYWKDTAIFIVEDDSQNGPDHVDSHRSIGYVISAYNRRNAVVHTPYTTENMLRTMETLLGVLPVSFHDANAAPMADLFMATPDLTPYTSIVPGVLCQAPVSPDLLGNACTSPARKKTRAVRVAHDGAWWALQTAGMDFRAPDRLDTARFNRLLWTGITGDAPLPARVAHADSADPDRDGR